jgi:hypothetical protein
MFSMLSEFSILPESTRPQKFHDSSRNVSEKIPRGFRTSKLVTGSKDYHRCVRRR